MPDQFDRAQDLDAYYQQQALDIWRQENTRNSTLSNTHCEDCGYEIPAGRRLAAPGCTRCRDCQQLWEKAR